MTNPTLEQRARTLVDADKREQDDVAYYGGPGGTHRPAQDALLAFARTEMLTFSHTGVEQAIEACAKVAEDERDSAMAFLEARYRTPHYAGYLMAALVITRRIRATLPAQSPDDIAYAGGAQGETYAQFQQKRGRLPDLIEEAIDIYTGFMKDDDYNAQGCLDSVVAKLKTARDWYPSDAAQPDIPAPSPVNVEGLVEALRPFSMALGTVAPDDFERWPDGMTIEFEGFCEYITVGDLRRARQALASISPDGER